MSKRAVKCFLVCTFLVVAVAGAQETTQQIATVLTIHTQLGSGPAYEAALGELWQAFRKAGVDRPIEVRTGISEPGDYIFISVFSKWGDLDAWNQKIQAGYASVPGVVESLQAVISSTDWSVWGSRPDLSYVPEKSRLPESERVFVRTTIVRPHPAKALEYQEKLKEAASLRRKHGLGDGVAVWQLWGGADGPAFALSTWARDEADFHAQSAVAIARMGAEWQAYLGQVGPLLRDVSYRSSRWRQDLAYTP